VWNKVRIVAKGYLQQKGFNYNETYSPITRLDVIQLLLSFAAISWMKLYQMDVKIAFLNEFIKEEVYVK